VRILMSVTIRHEHEVGTSAATPAPSPLCCTTPTVLLPGDARLGGGGHHRTRARRARARVCLCVLDTHELLLAPTAQMFGIPPTGAAFTLLGEIDILFDDDARGRRRTGSNLGSGLHCAGEAKAALADAPAPVVPEPPADERDLAGRNARASRGDNYARIAELVVTWDLAGLVLALTLNHAKLQRRSSTTE